MTSVLSPNLDQPQMLAADDEMTCLLQLLGAPEKLIAAITGATAGLSGIYAFTANRWEGHVQIVLDNKHLAMRAVSHS